MQYTMNRKRKRIYGVCKCIIFQEFLRNPPIFQRICKTMNKRFVSNEKTNEIVDDTMGGPSLPDSGFSSALHRMMHFACAICQGTRMCHRVSRHIFSRSHFDLDPVERKRSANIRMRVSRLVSSLVYRDHFSPRLYMRFLRRSIFYVHFPLYNTRPRRQPVVSASERGTFHYIPCLRHILVFYICERNVKRKGRG